MSFAPASPPVTFEVADGRGTATFDFAAGTEPRRLRSLTAYLVLRLDGPRRYRVLVEYADGRPVRTQTLLDSVPVRAAVRARAADPHAASVRVGRALVDAVDSSGHVVLGGGAEVAGERYSCRRPVISGP